MDRRGYKRGRGDAYATIPRAPRLGGMARRFRLQSTGSKSLSGAMSRVHVFKRVGVPLVVTNNPTAAARASFEGGNVSIGSNLTGGADSALSAFSEVRFATKYTLNNVAGVDEIKNLFDNYRIKKISLRIDFGFNTAPGIIEGTGAGSGSLTGGPWALPIMHYAYDADDASAVTSLENLLQNSYAKTVRLGDKSVNVSFTPRAQATVQATPGTAVSGGLLPVGQWLDCQSTAVEHYGMKFVLSQFPNLSSGGVACLSITPTFYIEAKNVI